MKEIVEANALRRRRRRRQSHKQVRRPVHSLLTSGILWKAFCIILTKTLPGIRSFSPRPRPSWLDKTRRNADRHRQESLTLLQLQTRSRNPQWPSTATKNTAFFRYSVDTALACQLLGMNCQQPTEFALSWPDFCQRGGNTDIHADGWGLAYYHGHGLRQFLDTEAASTSSLAKFLGQEKIQTRNMMAHIRYATSGTVDLANVHPFSREMWGLNWAFCHNGQVPLMEDEPDRFLGDVEGERFYFPVGNTDSEALFCALLNALRAKFTDNMPSLPILYDSLSKLCQEVVDYDRKGTILNFLLTCGPHVLWVYSWPGSRPGSDVWNGLHYTVRSNSTSLSDDDYSFDVSMPAMENDKDKEESSNSCCIVATKPLTTDEEWIELSPGELILFDNGLPHVSPSELFKVELGGHGLDNEGRAVIQRARLEEDMRQYQFQPEFFAAGGI